MSFWKESVFTIAELSKAIVANAQSIIAKLENNTNGLGAIKTGVDGANSALGDSTNGWAYLTRSSQQGLNVKVGNLSTSYSRTDAQITGVATPTTSTSAANKSYVDGV